MAYWIKRKCGSCGKEFLATPHGRKHCGSCWNEAFFKCKHSNVPVLIKSKK